MKKFFFSALLAATAMGTWLAGAARAQVSPSDTSQPVVVVAFSGYDEVIGDIGYVGKLAGNPGLARMAEMSLQMAAGGKEITGLDKSKPWGFFVRTDGTKLTTFGCLPVTNLDQVLEILEPLVGKPQKADGGLIKLSVKEQPLFVKKADGWAFVANTPEALAHTPDDPVAALGGLHKAYDLAIQVHVQNVPDFFRQMVVGMIRMGVQSGAQQMPGESSDDFAMRTKMTQRAMEQMQTAINELDTLTVGLAIDQERSSVHLDYTITAVEGSKIAEQMAASQGLSTNFAGFIVPDAAMSLNVVGKIPPSQIDQAVDTIETVRASAVKDLGSQGLSDDELKVAKGLVDNLIDVLVATVRGGRLDGGALLLLDESKAAFVAGLQVAESAKLEDALKQLAAQIIKDEPDAADAIKLDALVHQGVRFHTITIPTEDIPDEKIVQILGDAPEVALGFGDNSAYLAVGRDAIKTLQKVIDDCRAKAGKAAPPVSLSIAAGPIARFVAQMAEKPLVKQAATAVAGKLAESAGKDRLTITATIIPNGQKVRIELEEGLLKAIPALVPVVMQARAAP